jgi:hypothetical protein
VERGGGGGGGGVVRGSLGRCLGQSVQRLQFMDLLIR